MIHIGLEKICEGQDPRLKGKRIALLANQASTNRFFVHGRDLLRQTYPGQLVCLFSPQHGFFSEKQDNMVESAHQTDSVSGLPVYSLYGETRRPYPSMFADVDVLLIDLIDVGTRVYTFVWTVLYCLEVAAETGTKVIILDRPNPIGGHIAEGNILRKDCSSFVGMHTLPMRHGLTVGELALLCNREMGLHADLEVVTVSGWKRSMMFPATGFPWVFPSPNMPTFATALVYPGQVVWEGTNISEARGTTLPFELFGAPFLDHREVLDYLRPVDLPGCCFRPLCFEPTSGKWMGRACTGFQIHVTEADAFRPYRTSLALLQAMMHLYPGQFAYKEPPYEYEYERLPMDLILGDRSVREALEQGVPLREIEQGWQEGLTEYRQRIQAVFLYD
ncbi:MAG: exo-beta-N-acetylmuramidase NamZ domain-containing protein [Desulfobulbus sp.]